MAALIFIDTSAIVAILLGEAEAARLAETITQSKRRITSPLVRLEACMVLSTRLDMSPLRAEKIFDEFVAEAQVAIIPVTNEIGALAVEAFEKFGKGRGHKAQLNLADCMSYACAKAHNASILFVGRDFSQTDLAKAI